MAREQALETGVARRCGQLHVGRCIAAPVLPGGGDVFGEGVGLALLHADGEVQRQLVGAFLQARRIDLDAGRQADRRGFGHVQALLGLAVQP